jgi:hypothetical protein
MEYLRSRTLAPFLAISMSRLSDTPEVRSGHHLGYRTASPGQQAMVWIRAGHGQSPTAGPLLTGMALVRPLSAANCCLDVLMSSALGCRTGLSAVCKSSMPWQKVTPTRGCCRRPDTETADMNMRSARAGELIVALKWGAP